MNRGISYCTLLALGVVVGACNDGTAVGREASEVVLPPQELSLECTHGVGGATVLVARRDSAFDISATATDTGTPIFQAARQRPSLNARLEDGTSSLVSEFVDFSDEGLVSVPMDGPKALEIDLFGARTLTYRDGATTIQLACTFEPEQLRQFLSFDRVTTSELTARVASAKAVAFDIDDTLAFTTPAFLRGTATGGTPVPADVLFWTHTNRCDLGCPSETITLPDGSTKLLPANAPSTRKSKAVELIAFHKSRGARVYAITARPDIEGTRLREYVEQELGIARADVFFEPDIDLPGNPKGKTDRIESLQLDVFYGDSDADITDARGAFVTLPPGASPRTVAAIRFLRTPKSSNRKAGKLNKYHPGYFGEPILEDSYE